MSGMICADVLAPGRPALDRTVVGPLRSVPSHLPPQASTCPFPCLLDCSKEVP